MSAFDATGYLPTADASYPVSGAQTAIVTNWDYGTITRDAVVNVTGELDPIIANWAYGTIGSTNDILGAFDPIVDSWQ